MRFLGWSPGPFSPTRRDQAMPFGQSTLPKSGRMDRRTRRPRAVSRPRLPVCATLPGEGSHLARVLAQKVAGWQMQGGLPAGMLTGAFLAARGRWLSSFPLPAPIRLSYGTGAK